LKKRLLAILVSPAVSCVVLRGAIPQKAGHVCGLEKNVARIRERFSIHKRRGQDDFSARTVKINNISSV